MNEIFLLGNIALDTMVYTELDNFKNIDSEYYTANISEYIGGCIINMAIVGKYINAKTEMVSLVANDSLGDILLNQLTEVGLSTEYIFPTLKNNNRTILIVNTEGNKIMFAEKAIVTDLDSIVIPNDCKAVHFAPFDDWCYQSAKLLHKINPTISFSTDFQIDTDFQKHKESISLANIIFFSGAGKNDISYHMKQLLSLGSNIVCCTNGEDGCYIGTKGNNNIKHYKAIKPENPIIDTAGAGDVFAATFLHYYYKDNSVNRAVLKAQIQAGKSCTNKKIQDLYSDFELEKLAFKHENQGIL